MKRSLQGSRALRRILPAALAALVLGGVGPALLRPIEAGPPKGAPGVPDKELQKAIDRAIARGADFLRAQQKDSGKIGNVFHQGAVHYEIGTTALAGLALLAAGDRAAKRDPKDNDAKFRGKKKHVDKALDYCRRKDLVRGQAGSRTTYDTGVLLMFAAEYYHPHLDKKGRPIKHTVTKKQRDNPCKLPEDASKWIRDMKSWLISVQEKEGGWSYPKPREDLSNTQYALLGLRAARDCGGKVPGRVFKRVIERMLATQEQDGPKVLRSIGGTKKGDTIYKIESGDKARGWSYLTSPFLATGSMTTSAIGCLAISHDALTEPKRSPLYDKPLENKVRRAIQDGFAWLDINFTVKSNPPSAAPNWHYYFLYGLERAAMLAGRPLIGEHDWYLEGARYLIRHQQPNGRWATGALGGKEYQASDVLDTAWAILFLKKATKPVKPIPGPVITK